MRRFFIDIDNIKGKVVEISGKEAHHMKDVIRLKRGDRFIGFDGRGKSYTLRVINADKKIITEIEKVSLGKRDGVDILLAVALPKMGKIDSIIEKATELGVSVIIPMVTERTIVKVNRKTVTNKKSRWEKIALEASKQCGRDTLPAIYEPKNFKDALDITEKLGYKERIIPYVGEGSKVISDILKKRERVAVFIGPEGDFTEEEIDQAKRYNFIPISLGQLVLRVDTACLFALSAIQTILQRS